MLGDSTASVLRLHTPLHFPNVQQVVYLFGYFTFPESTKRSYCRPIFIPSAQYILIPSFASYTADDMPINSQMNFKSLSPFSDETSPGWLVVR